MRKAAGALSRFDRDEGLRRLSFVEVPGASYAGETETRLERPKQMQHVKVLG